MKRGDILNLGKRIKNIRESKGLTQEDVFTGIVSNSHYIGTQITDKASLKEEVVNSTGDFKIVE